MYVNRAPIPAEQVVFSAPIGSFDPQATPILLRRVLAACTQSPLQSRAQRVACFCQWNNYRSFLPDIGGNSYSLGECPRLNEPLLRVSFYLGLKQTAELSDLGALQAWWSAEEPTPCVVVCPAVHNPLLDGPTPQSTAGEDCGHCADLQNRSSGRLSGSPFRVMTYTVRVTIDWQTRAEGLLVLSFGDPDSVSPDELAITQNLVTKAFEKATDEVTHHPEAHTRPKIYGACIPDLDVSGFASGVDSLQSDMKQGICYLANLTITQNIPKELLSASPDQFLKRWFGSTDEHPNPSRFGWYIHTEDFQLESYSPERFIRREGDVILTEPIKGTVRVSEPQAAPSDGQFTNLNQSTESLSGEPELGAAQMLWSSCKERAEQHLVTDLLRNDLSQICRPGTVTVCNPFEVRIDSGLAQMCTTIWGHAERDQTLPRVLGKILPAGSVTGTPKRQVCLALSRLEPHNRGYYTGLCIDVRKDDDFEATLLIRSVFSDPDGSTYAGAGGGITVLSRADLETAEVKDKWRSFLLRCSK